MLYHLYELQQTMTRPARAGWSALGRTLLHPANPISRTTTGRALGATLDIWGGLGRRPEKPRFAIVAVQKDGRSHAVREEVAVTTPWCELRRFTLADRPAGAVPRVLLVAPMSGNHATLLRDTVAGLVEEHEVWITDWRCARMVPLREGNFGFDDYVAHVQTFLRHLGPGAHAVAVCQPGVPVLAAVALMAEDGDPAVPVSLTLMGGPIDTRINPGVPNKLAQQHSLAWFRRTLVTHVPARYPGHRRAVYPGFMQITAFVSMKAELHWDKHVRYAQAVIEGDEAVVASHNAFYDEFLATMDLPAEFYLETVDRVFQRHLLPRGELRVGGRRVRPEAITTTALLTVEGEKDDITGPGQCSAAHDLCTAIPAARRGRWLQSGAGHMGVFSGRRWRDEVRPVVAEFIRAAER